MGGASVSQAVSASQNPCDHELREVWGVCHAAGVCGSGARLGGARLPGPALRLVPGPGLWRAAAAEGAAVRAAEPDHLRLPAGHRVCAEPQRHGGVQRAEGLCHGAGRVHARHLVHPVERLVHGCGTPRPHRLLFRLWPVPAAQKDVGSNSGHCMHWGKRGPGEAEGRRRTRHGP